MSLFFEKSAQTTYNTNQKDYLDCSLRVVNRTIEKIKTSKEDRRLLFSQIIDFFGEQRQKVASTYGTEDSQKFGLRRDLHWIASYTSLLERYQGYGDLVIERVHSSFQKAALEKHPWPKETFHTCFEPCLGRIASSEILLIEENDQNAMFPARTLADFQHMYGLCRLELPLYFAREGETYFKRHDALEELILNEKAMERLARKSPQDYQKLQNTFTLLSAQRREGISVHANWVLVNQYLAMEGQKRLISQYLLECYHDPSRELGFGCFHATLIHQDPLTIRLTIDQMADLFQKTLIWQKDVDPREDLKKTVALLMYEWAHATPFLRGSAATGEWLEQAIYGYHKLVCEYNPKKTANLEALTSPLHEFIEAYDSMITVIDPYNPDENPLPSEDEWWEEEEMDGPAS